MSDLTTENAARDKGLADYLAQMDAAGGGIYTADFRDGFRHALAMLAAFESDEPPAPDRVRPEVREAARLALSRRLATEYPAGHGFTPGRFGGGCRVMLARYPCNWAEGEHDPSLPPEDIDHFGYHRIRPVSERGDG